MDQDALHFTTDDTARSGLWFENALCALEPIAENVFLFRDTCFVYVIRSGREAVLIDFGSGGVLDELPGLGIERVTAVLMTHHHRDQGQGLARAALAGIPIWAPEAERDLFQSVDDHWQARTLYNNYDVRQDRFSLLYPASLAGALRDYATYLFGAHRFTAIPTPGHTPGSVSLLAEIDGKRMVFTGDLIAAPGRLWSLAATQWAYSGAAAGAEGVAATVLSLLDLRDRRPDLLLPSHGQVMASPADAIDPLVSKLRELLALREQHGRLLAFRDQPYVALTPHLLWNRTSLSYSYVLLSTSGAALVLDFGYDFTTGLPAGSDRSSRRPWLYTLPALKREWGVERIEAAIPTHYHDDHVAGLNLLREAEGTQIWAAENFAEILEQPARCNLPCLWFDPIPVERRLPLGRPIQWREYTLTLHELPGHTRWAVAIAFEVDGQQVLVTGDQYQGGEGYQWNYVYQNGFHPGDYARGAEVYRQVAPDLILRGHWEPQWVQPGFLDKLQQRDGELARLHAEILAEGAGPAGGPCAALHPYQARLCGGETAHFQVEVTNPLPRPAQARARIVLPPGWAAVPAEGSLSLEAHGAGRLAFEVRAPAGVAVRRARLAADIWIDERALGQQAEALITVEL